MDSPSPRCSMRPRVNGVRGLTLVRAALTSLAVTALIISGGCFGRGELISQRILDDAARRRQLGILPTPTASQTAVPASVTPSPTRTPLPGRTFATVRRVWDGNTILVDAGY